MARFKIAQNPSIPFVCKPFPDENSPKLWQTEMCAKFSGFVALWFIMLYPLKSSVITTVFGFVTAEITDRSCLPVNFYLPHLEVQHWHKLVQFHVP